MTLRAAVLSIGTELTRGEITNTNASWLGEKLTAIGLDVVEHRTVDDDRERIVAAIRSFARTARFVVATGGLGPTTDDITSEAAAEAAGVGLVRDEASLLRIRALWEARGWEMPSSNEKQADFPAGARVLPNPVGTAPGFQLDLEGCRFFFLPGVPHEMQRLFADEVEPAIAPAAERTSHQVRLHTFGLTESDVGERLAGLEGEHPGATLGYRAHFPEIEVKVLARAGSADEAVRLARTVAHEVRERLGEAVFGEGEETFPEVVVGALRERGLKLAVAESCTGGLVGYLVTKIPGSSDTLLLDAVTYSNESKTALLGVSGEILARHGAVSPESAAAMAEGALRLSGADIAVSVTGIAGPGGGTEEKPVGTVWFGLARKGAPTVTRSTWLPWDRERIRTLSAYVALRMVARAARGQEDPVL